VHPAIEFLSLILLVFPFFPGCEVTILRQNPSACADFVCDNGTHTQKHLHTHTHKSLSSLSLSLSHTHTRTHTHTQINRILMHTHTHMNYDITCVHMRTRHKAKHAHYMSQTNSHIHVKLSHQFSSVCSVLYSHPIKTATKQNQANPVKHKAKYAHDMCHTNSQAHVKLSYHMHKYAQHIMSDDNTLLLVSLCDTCRVHFVRSQHIMYNTLCAQICTRQYCVPTVCLHMYAQDRMRHVHTHSLIHVHRNTHIQPHTNTHTRI